MNYNKFEIIDSFGDTVIVEPELQLYTLYDFMENKMPGLAIELYSYDEEGFREPYATLTVNLGEFFGIKDCAYIDTNNNSFTAQLLDKGFCQDTGLTKQSGFWTYPLWKFDKDFLKAIDVHGLYQTYEKKFDKYMEEGAELPVHARADDILEEVLNTLGVKDIELWFAVENGEVTASRNGEKWVGADFYRYLLAEVCEYDDNGAVKGLELDLCHDFYDLCEHNGVKYTDYNKPASNGEIEYVITMSSGGGTVRDFLTCSSRKEAEDVCQGYDWRFVDENAFEWSLNIDEREVSLDSKLAVATERSAETDTAKIAKGEPVKE